MPRQMASELYLKNIMCRGGGGQRVYVFAFYSDDLSSNPSGECSYNSAKLFENIDNKSKRAGVMNLIKTL